MHLKTLWRKLIDLMFPEITILATKDPWISSSMLLGIGSFGGLLILSGFLLVGPARFVSGFVHWIDARSLGAVTLYGALQALGYLMGVPAATMRAFQVRQHKQRLETSADLDLFRGVLKIFMIYTVLSPYGSFLLSVWLTPLLAQVVAGDHKGNSLIEGLVLSLLLSGVGSVFALPPIWFLTWFTPRDEGTTGRQQREIAWRRSLLAALTCWEIWVAQAICLGGFVGIVDLTLSLAQEENAEHLLPVLFSLAFLATTSWPSTPASALVNFLFSHSGQNRTDWARLGDNTLVQLEWGLLFALMGGVPSTGTTYWFLSLNPTAGSWSQNLANGILSAVVRKFTNVVLADVRTHVAHPGPQETYKSFTLQFIQQVPSLLLLVFAILAVTVLWLGVAILIIVLVLWSPLIIAGGVIITRRLVGGIFSLTQ